MQHMWVWLYEFNNWRFSCPIGKDGVYGLLHRHDICAHLLWNDTMMAPQMYT